MLNQLSKKTRFIVVFFILFLCGYLLYPSVYWYFFYSEDKKQQMNKSPQEVMSLQNEKIDLITQLQEMIPFNKQKLKDSKRKNWVFNIRPHREFKESIIINIDNQDSLLKRLFGSQADTKKDKFLKIVSRMKNIDGELQLFRDFQQLQKKVVKLGLDLSGGTQLTIAVDKINLIDRIRIQYEIFGIKDTNSSESIAQAGKIPNWNKVSVNEKKLKEFLLSQLDSEKDKTISDEKIQQEKKAILNRYQNKIETELADCVDNALTVIQNRIDRFGVSEIKINKGINDTLFIELPGLDKRDIESTIKTIMDAGELTFQIVNKDWMEKIPVSLLNQKGKYRGYIDPNKVYQKDGIYQIHNENISSYLNKQYDISFSKKAEDSGLYPMEESDEFGNQKTVGFLILHNKVDVEGRYLSDVSVGYEPNTNIPEVLFSLDTTGAGIFYTLTSKNIGHRLAILLDSKVKSAPVINGPISNSGRITLGNEAHVYEEARSLVAILKAGVLPTRLNLVSQLSIGPKLGKDNIRKGLQALGLAFVLVSVFLCFYYKTSGLVALFALICNLYILFSVLSAFAFTLTLPGIAGILLTIGMSIDANIIIFERMKEEMEHPETNNFSVISSGYQKAFSAIFDSNITTILVAFILANIGSGIVKGFGFTLMWGIISSMFTALFVTRLIFDFFTQQMRIKKIYI